MIAGRPERFTELLERSIATGDITESLYLDVVGPRAFVPWPRLISNPVEFGFDDD